MAVLVENIFRWLFSWVDRVVIVALNAIYGLLMKLATLNIVNMDTIKAFSNRIGLILGIFMLFNLAINLLSYIVSPDKFSDSKQGGSKIIANVAISLVLLGTINIIFEHAYKLQFAVLKKQIIPQIIFGTSGQDPTDKVEISYYIFSGMISINPAVDKNGLCDGVYFTGYISEECEDLIHPSLDSGYYNFERAVMYKDASKLLTADNITATKKVGDNKEFVFNYFFLFSTVIGVITTLIIFNFCLDIAKRTVKLYFYQLIAPIPIIANMIPGKGSEMFKKWYKSCIATYFDVFIRLIALFFAIFVMTTIYSSLSDVFSEHPVLAVFIILGALMFAKEIPQLIQDLTGLKLDGGFAINPIRKLNQVPALGKGFGAVGGAIAGGRAGGRVGNRLGGALTGAFMGANSIPLGGSKDGKLALSSATNDVYKRMTGSEFINFSLAKAPLRHGAKARIDEIKAARNVATEQLNEYNTDLNTSQKLTTDLAARLSAQGLDVGDILNNSGQYKSKLERLKQQYSSKTSDYAKNNAEMAALETQKNALNAELSKRKNAAEGFKRMLQNSGLSDSAKEQINKQLSQTEERIKKMNEEMANINSEHASKMAYKSSFEKELKNYEDIGSYIDRFEEQNELRKRISAVQKDIDDLNNEKRQRERFYDYDPSPQSDIQTLVSNTNNSTDSNGRTVAGADNYRARIDGKVKK